MSKHLIQAMKHLQKAQEEVSNKVERHEKVIMSQGKDIAALEKQVLNLRNAAIRAEIEAGYSQLEVADRYNLSPGRISQIKNS